MPSSTGSCQGEFQNYFYDSTTSACKPFTYYGCHGNENNFQTLYDCQIRCEGKHENIIV